MKPSWWYWLPPKDAGSFFRKDSDSVFRYKHPFLYPLFVVLAIAALMAPCFLYCLLLGQLHRISSIWTLLGYIGAFIMGIGIFNLIAIVVRQYLGHLVTLCAFGLGTIMMLLGLTLG